MFHQCMSWCGGIALLSLTVLPSHESQRRERKPFEEKIAVVRAAPPVDFLEVCPHTKDFSLRAECVEALAGGPFIVKLTLEYHGHKPLLAELGEDWYPSGSGTAPVHWIKSDHWMKRPLFPGEGTVNGMVFHWPHNFKPGEQVSGYLFLHHHFRNIPAGKTSFLFNWCLGKLDNDGRFIDQLRPNLGVPETQCVIQVLPATAKNLKAARERFLAVLLGGVSAWPDEKHWLLAGPAELPSAGEGGPQWPKEKYWMLRRWLTNTDHPEVFAPLCLRYLVLLPYWSGGADGLLLRYLVDCEKRVPKIRGQLIDFLVAHGTGAIADEVIQCWHDSAVVPSDTEIARLMQARDPGVRAIFARDFPDRVPQAAKQLLLRELDALRRVVEGKQPQLDAGQER